MEERAAANDHHLTTYRDDDLHNHHHHDHHDSHEDEQELFDESMQIVPSSGPHETYIIQIPKDQIYRVPPPENAEIVERYRKPVEKTSRGGRRCVYWFLSIFFVVAFIVSVIVCVHKFTLTPDPPTFSIKHLSLKQPSKKTSSPAFEVSIETRNPNKVNDVGYKQGSVSLLYKGKEIGKGNYPAKENQGTGQSDDVNVVIAGSKGGLPKELQEKTEIGSSKSRKDRSSSSSGVTMNLSMNIPMILKTWLWNNNVDFNVKCEFEMDSFGDNMKVQSQKCDVNK